MIFRLMMEIAEKQAHDRYKIYLDTGYHDGTRYSKTYDMLCFMDYYKE